MGHTSQLNVRAHRLPVPPNEVFIHHSVKMGHCLYCHHGDEHPLLVSVGNAFTLMVTQLPQPFAAVSHGMHLHVLEHIRAANIIHPEEFLLPQTIADNLPHLPFHVNHSKVRQHQIRVNAFQESDELFKI